MAKRRHVLPRAKHRSYGTTLIEVLVTLVVISVGLLGIAGLQLVSLRNNKDATIRTQASVLAADIADRMRANRTAALNDQYNLEIDTSPGTGTTIPEDDLTAWRTTLAQQLPNGTGSVDRITGNVFTITIQWRERGDADPVEFQTSTEI
ncbi:type IV pilus assembly protein PilV [Steroidobacter denitrificans]|uniref:Type IV pilus assembly protein PilV n=1 Tax=Steroidobacter denitrificans TaxID=465721 RepID=A0A127FCD9_STEDE|nr:type IV pilus modification protein PilV [Steroidobacter denitrificans]AMN47265.1 type IV pilus assembly protein PilV [Steroidobacter denitrificans]